MSQRTDAATSSDSTGPAPYERLTGKAGERFLGHPKGLFLLFLVEMWERFSYYGMRGLLVLYLTAAIAAHQLKPATYTNTLVIEQTPDAPVNAPVNAPADAPADAKTKAVTGVLRLPLSVAVGGSAASAESVVIGPDGAGPLKFERVIPGAKPDEWVPEPGETRGLTPVAFAVKEGVHPTDGKPVYLRITNPTDAGVKLVAKLERPFPPGEAEKEENKGQANPKYKVYFKVNDGTSVLSTNIPPDAKRDADHPPFVVTIDLNRLDSGRSWIKANANTLYGWYTGMAYLLPILGGLIADKLIGTHRSMVVGGLLIALGHIVLGISGIGDMSLNDTGMTVFVMGLALITIGTGHFKPSVSVMVGQLYPPDDPRRESAFSIFYMGINLGSFLCNLACGWLAAKYGWHYGFGAAAVGMLLGISTYLSFRRTYLPGIGEPIGGKVGLAPAFFPIGIALAAGVAALYHFGVLGLFDEFMGNPIVYKVVIGAAIAYGLFFIVRQEPRDRAPVATIFIYMLFNALFWLSFEQAGSSLNTFTEELTDRRLLGGLVPAPYFQSINPLLIIIFAPIFGAFWASLARKNKSIAQPYKIGTGLIFVGLGYVVMVLAALRLNTGLPKVGMIFISGCYFLHTVGEIILSPTGLSYVAKTAPKKHVSSLMGIWFISSFIAGLGAGKVGALVDPIIEGKVKLPWNLGGQADFFALFVVTSIAAGVLILLIAPLLTRLQRDRRH